MLYCFVQEGSDSVRRNTTDMLLGSSSKYRLTVVFRQQA